MKILLLRKCVIVVFILTIFSIFLLTSGCVTRMPSQTVQGIPSYSQEEEVMDGIFKLKIEEAYWRDDLDMSETWGGDYSMLQQANVQMPKFKPDAKFLVIVISLTNTGQKPSAMTHGLMLRLKNKNDVEYSVSLKVAGMGNAFASGVRFMSYNPNMPEKYKIIFDVPKDDYTLVVFKTGVVSFERVFEWELNRVKE